MSTVFDEFKKELIELCEKHGVCIYPGYDNKFTPAIIVFSTPQGIEITKDFDSLQDETASGGYLTGKGEK